MTTDATYNGWTNRETWAFVLHLNNDEGIQSWALEHVRACIQTANEGRTADEIGRDLIEGFLSMHQEGMFGDWGRVMLEDIGSTWRIDYAAIGESFGDDAIEGDDNFTLADGYYAEVF